MCFFITCNIIFYKMDYCTIQQLIKYRLSNIFLNKGDKNIEQISKSQYRKVKRILIIRNILMKKISDFIKIKRLG